MTNTIFYALFFSLFLNVSVGSLKYSQIHRTFLRVYKGMIEACTITMNTVGAPVEPYFSVKKMKKYVTQYFKENLSKYTDDYTVTYRFVTEDDNVVCKSECRRLYLKLTAKISSFYNYENEQYFTIRDGDVL